MHQKNGWADYLYNCINGVLNTLVNEEFIFSGGLVSKDPALFGLKNL